MRPTSCRELSKSSAFSFHFGASFVISFKNLSLWSVPFSAKGQEGAQPVWSLSFFMHSFVIDRKRQYAKNLVLRAEK